jgi:homoserine O-acetyltransferase
LYAAENLGDSIDASTETPNPRFVEFSKDLRFELESGKRFGPVKIAFKAFGELNADKSNAVLIFPTLTATPQVAKEEISGKVFPGWWQGIVGKGKAIDPEKFFVICADHFGGCYGSTGPSSKNPDTGKPYGMKFPAFFLRDIVNCNWELLRQLGIEKLHAVAGGSLGGLLAMELAALHKNAAKHAIILGASHRISAQSIALNHLARQAIMLDPDWNNGNYYGKAPPAKGLSIARQIGHISYLNPRIIQEKFGREEVGKLRHFVSVPMQYQVESYLNHQGEKFSKRFDANSYIYLSKAIDSFDIEREFGSLKNAFAGSKTKFTGIAITSDVLFPKEDAEEMNRQLKEAGVESRLHIVKSANGHDAIFTENEKIGKIIKKALAE